jgi:small subunit ribosomal protein S20
MIRRLSKSPAPMPAGAALTETVLANHKSALKRARQSIVRRKRNTHVKSTMRTHVKRFRAAIEAGDVEDAAAKLRTAERAIRKAASKGVIPARRASRSVSRLSKQLGALRAG